jgi:hypothetical protein
VVGKPASEVFGPEKRVIGSSDNIQDYYTSKKAAQWLGVSLSTLEKWRRRGLGPVYYRVGPRLIRYERHALESFRTADPSK